MQKAGTPIKNYLKEMLKKKIIKKIVKTRKTKTKYRHVPSGKRVLDIQQGANLLQKFALKNAFICPLDAFKEKINKKDMHNKMESLFVIKRRKIRDSLRVCINKWR